MSGRDATIQSHHRGQNVFRSVCEAADPAEFIGKLQPYAYSDLYLWLRQHYEPRGISGEVYGMLLVEGARRYAERAATEMGGEIL